MIKRSLFALALAAALPVSAQAADDGLSFTYVEADYINADVSDLDLDGFGVRGNVGFHENWYATGSFARTSDGDVDVGLPETADFDLERSTIGIGFHTAIGNRVHFLAEAAYVNYGFENEIPSIGTADENYDGYRGTAGIRALLGPKFELEGKAHYTHVDELDGGFGAEVNGVFHVNSTWGIAAGFERQDFDGGDLDEWKIGVRASF